MGSRSLLALFLLLASFCGSAQVFVVGMKTAEADAVTEFHATHVEIPGGKLDERGKLDLIRNLEAEQGFAHRNLPLGAGLELIANGNLFPRDEEYKQMLYDKGQSAGPGDRVQITALKFQPDAIVIDFNGGPYAKHRFLSHITLNDMPVAQRGPEVYGCRVTLVFEGGVPQVTAADVKALLDPVVDFKAKSSAEAYADSLPPRIREAIEAHEVLVGMDRRMVIAAVGAPKARHREHTKPGDENSPMWEEWIYGTAPEATEFVRIRDGHVVRLEIAELGKPVVIREGNETGVTPGPTLATRTIQNGDAQRDSNGEHGRPAPTLRNPGEPIDPSARTVGKVNLPTDSPSRLIPDGI
jgi:hypothetical protein